jgi:Recombinase zinc beta ribbon domain
MSRGSVRRGEALLAGLLRCGHCGRKLHVAYSGTHRTVGRYHCRGSQMNHGGDRCISFGGLRLDRAISAEVIARLQPLGIDAALAAMEARGREHADKLRQLDLALEQARYEAARSQRQYEAVDPDNRLVAGELERRWNERLLAVRGLEGEREALLGKPETPLSEVDRERLLALGSDLERAWDSSGATPATRKRIIRTLIHEIIVHVLDEILDLVIHWQGGDHTALQVRKNRKGQPLEHISGCRRSRSCIVATDARQHDRRGPQPRRQGDRARQQLDPCPCLRSAQAARHRSLSGGRACGARRDHPG